jgi:hypothetical protein
MKIKVLSPPSTCISIWSHFCSRRSAELLRMDRKRNDELWRRMGGEETIIEWKGKY